MLPISSNCGLPICLTGISRPLLLSLEMDDHERTRETMKRKKFQEILQLHEMIRAQNREASGNGKSSSVATNEFCHAFLYPVLQKLHK